MGPNGHDSEQAASAIIGVTFTGVLKSGGDCTKTISLGANGKVKSDGAACWISAGHMFRVHWPDWRGFVETLGKMPGNGAIVLGTLRDDLPDRVSLFADYDRRSKNPGCAARTMANLTFRSEPTLMLVDHDTKHFSESVSEKLAELGGFPAALEVVIPEIAKAGTILRASTSSGLSNSVTGDVYPSSGGFHLYILVENGVDIPRFFRVVQDLCWLHGLAGFWITKDGKLDEYSIVDVSVGSAERLVFEADPKVNQPLVQAPRPATLRGGNTALATTEINADKSREKISKLKSSAKSKLKAAAAEVRENYITEKANELEARGVDPITARETAEKFVKDYVLGPEMTVEFIKSELGVVDVATILADPARFDHQSCFDPVEGRDYGRTNAMFFADRRVIHSFAHGRRKFKLCAKSDEPPTARNEGETIFSLGIEKRLTSFESLNERFAIMQVSGQPSVYISRPDLMPIQDIDLSRRLMK